MDKKSFIGLIVVIVVALSIGRLFEFNSPAGAGGTNPSISAPAENLTFSDLSKTLNDNPSSIKKLTIVNGSNTVIVERDGKKPVTVAVPDDGGKQLLVNKADGAKVPVDAKEEAKPSETTGAILNFLFMFGPIILIGLFFFWMIRSQQKMQGQMRQQLSKTDAGKIVDKKTFADVAGCDEAIKKLQRITNFQRKKPIFGLFRAKLPKGVLLVGPSGTGKTLLAKAVAGEIDGAFFPISGSEFVEMFVGVGASRVRELFQTANKTATATGKPVVIFIDEIDAVGGKRSSGFNGGGHQEREQTLNQILVEMDGVQSNPNVIVIAATNRADILDPALMRPGRFTYHVLVDLPDVAGRVAIFGIHTRDKKELLAPEVDLQVLGQRTYSYSGADIEAVCNEAAIIAAERVDDQTTSMRAASKNEQEINAAVVRKITLNDFDEAIDTVRLGEARKSRLAAMPLTERMNTTYHEVGHGWISEHDEGGDPVVKITNVPRERALGYTQSQPLSGDRFSLTLQQARARIRMAMGGRAAQEIFLNTVDTGASNDFEQATKIAANMVKKWGMSSLGHISVGESGGSPFGTEGGADNGYHPHGQAMGDEIDKLVREILEDAYQHAKKVIERDREQIEVISQVLLQKETILRPEWVQLCKQYPPKDGRDAAPAPTADGDVTPPVTPGDGDVTPTDGDAPKA
jgi:cell division protease FtsH